MWSHSFIFLSLQPYAFFYDLFCFFIVGRGRSSSELDGTSWRNILLQKNVLLKITWHVSVSLSYFGTVVWFSLLLLFYFFSWATFPPLTVFASFSASLLPSCSSFPLQGGRHVTAVGGWQACHTLLCLGLHQNIPPQVTLATAFPFDHPTVVWRKWQHFSFGQFSPVTPQKVTLTFNSFPLGMIHDLCSYVGQLMFIFDFWKS